MRALIIPLCLAAGCAAHAETPLIAPEDVVFLRELAEATLEASRVRPGETVAGIGPNSSGGTLIRPGGRNAYPAYWIRDYAMSLESGVVPLEEQRHALTVAAAHQVDKETVLPTGSRLPVGSIPDHISFGGVPIYFPGILEDYEKQGGEQWGLLPCLDDQYFFIHMARQFQLAAREDAFLRETHGGKTLFSRLEAAYAMPPSDPGTGLVRVGTENRGVNFGFFDTVTHTGDLLFCSVLKHRAAMEMADMATPAGQPEREAFYRTEAARIADALPRVFQRPDGWFAASTGTSAQPDVWGTAFAVWTGAVTGEPARRACAALAKALRDGTIAWEGGIRHVPQDLDYSAKAVWEKCLAARNRYQNGAYWDTPVGWVAHAAAQTDPEAAAALVRDYLRQLRADDFRKGDAFGAPWECRHPEDNHRQNPVYLTSVTAPLAVFLSDTPPFCGIAVPGVSKQDAVRTEGSPGTRWLPMI